MKDDVNPLEMTQKTILDAVLNPDGSAVPVDIVSA